MSRPLPSTARRLPAFTPPIDPHAESHMLAGADPVLGAVRFLGEATMTGAQTVNAGSAPTNITDLVLTVRTRGGRLLIMWTGQITLTATTFEAEGHVVIKVNGLPDGVTDGPLSDQQMKLTAEGSATLLPFGTILDIPINTTAYVPPGFSQTYHNVDSGGVASVVCPFAGTVSRLFVHGDNSLDTASTTVTVRKNEVDTTLDCAIAAGVDSGSEPSSAFSVAAGDRLSIKVVTANSGAGNWNNIAASVVLQRSDGMNTILTSPGTKAWLYVANPGKYVLQAAVTSDANTNIGVSADCTLIVFELLPEARG